VKTFVTWLVHEGRIEAAPVGLMKSAPLNEKEDRRLVRRALTKDELARLLAAAEAGPPIEAVRGPGTTRKNLDPAGSISGPQRALLYRLAMGTGFRANEIRTLTPENFRLEGDEPSIAWRPGTRRTARARPCSRSPARWPPSSGG
jgi:integrase